MQQRPSSGAGLSITRVSTVKNLHRRTYLHIERKVVFFEEGESSAELGVVLEIIGRVYPWPCECRVVGVVVQYLANAPHLLPGVRGES